MVSAQESMPNQNCQLNLQKPRIVQTFKCRSVVMTDIRLILVAGNANIRVFYTGICSLQ